MSRSERIWVAIPLSNPEKAISVAAKSILKEKFALTEREAYRKKFPFKKDGILFVETKPETYSRKK